MNDEDLVIELSNKHNKFDQYNEYSCIRKSWEEAKKKNQLTGCGLMGRLTMDEIEELKTRVETAMTEWARLAGNMKFRSLPSDPMIKELETNKSIRDLEDKVTVLTLELQGLRKKLEQKEKTKGVKPKEEESSVSLEVV